MSDLDYDYRYVFIYRKFAHEIQIEVCLNNITTNFFFAPLTPGFQETHSYSRNCESAAEAYRLFADMRCQLLQANGVLTQEDE